MSLFSFLGGLFGSKPPTPTESTPQPIQPVSQPAPAPAPTHEPLPVVPQAPVPAPVQITPAPTETTAYTGLPIVKFYEGCKLTAYQDIVGVWTIGYGETRGVYPGMTITQQQADAMVSARYEEFQKEVQALVKVPITQNQLGALTSFAYNLGTPALAGSTLLKFLNSNVPAAVVAQQFARWNMAGGKPVAGLTARRAAEAKLFLTP